MTVSIEKASTNTSKKVVFKTVNEDALPPKAAAKIDMRVSSKPASTTRHTSSNTSPAAHQKRPHVRTERTRAALHCTKVLVSDRLVDHEPTPPAALSAKGRALKALQEWEEIENPGVEYTEKDSGEADKEASGVEETEDGWMVV